MKLTIVTTLIATAVAALAEPQYGQIQLALPNQQPQGHINFDYSQPTSTAYIAPYRDGYKGYFKLENSNLYYETPDITYHVSAGQRWVDNLPIMAASSTTDDDGSQPGFYLKDGLLYGPGDIGDFYSCYSSQYPNGNLIVFFANHMHPSPPDHTRCDKLQTRWFTTYV